MGLAPDKTYTNQLKAAEILERLSETATTPGVAHYLIHTYDYPPIAAKGLAGQTLFEDRARCAPCAAHAGSLDPRRPSKDLIPSNADWGASPSSTRNRTINCTGPTDSSMRLQLLRIRKRGRCMMRCWG